MFGVAEPRRDPMRQNLVAPNYSTKRDSANYPKYGLTGIVRNAHSGTINCICWLRNGVFATGSSDKTIKIWCPSEA